MGLVGTIVATRKNGTSVGVDFGFNTGARHTLSGRVPRGNGRWFFTHQVAPVHRATEVRTNAARRCGEGRDMFSTYLKPLTTFIKSQKAPMRNYLRLGWVEVVDNDFVVTSAGKTADQHARIVLSTTLEEYAKSEVERREEEEKKRK
jgi:hypothetical protein